VTAVNFVFEPHQACIATDTLITSRNPQHASKILAMPHARCVVAFSGSLVIFADLAATLLAGCTANVEVLIQGMPRTLCDLRERWGGAIPPTSVYLLGVAADDTIRVATFSSEADFVAATCWRPWTCYVSPMPAAQTATRPAVAESPAPAPPALARPMPGRWRDCVATILEAMHWQHRDNPDTIGGRIQCTYLTPGAIHQTWLGMLEE